MKLTPDPLKRQNAQRNADSYCTTFRLHRGSGIDPPRYHHQVEIVLISLQTAQPNSVTTQTIGKKTLSGGPPKGSKLIVTNQHTAPRAIILNCQMQNRRAARSSSRTSIRE